MARTGETWDEYEGSYVAVPWSEGRDILVRGTSRYLNFGTLVGTSGYGFRDNGGTMQYKNNGGSWANIGSGGSGTPGGSDTQVQFNDGGTFGGDAGMTYNKTTDTLTLAGDVEITDTTKGVIIRSPDNTRWRITITNNGELVATSL